MQKRCLCKIMVFLLVVLHFGDLLGKEPKTGNRVTNQIGMEFVYVEPGSFLMGIPPAESIGYFDQKQHSVQIDYGYYLQTTEVTQRQWQVVMGTNPSHFKGADLPVENVSKEDVLQFITRLNLLEPDTHYRLPSEEEWEYACRAGTTTNYFWGKSMDGAYCWYSENSEHRSHPVGSTLPNEWGLYDMSGNVWEWCQTCYRGSTSAAAEIPKERIFEESCVIRGGGWQDIAEECQSTARMVLASFKHSYLTGFRLVRLEK